MFGEKAIVRRRLPGEPTQLHLQGCLSAYGTPSPQQPQATLPRVHPGNGNGRTRSGHNIPKGTPATFKQKGG